MNNLKSIYLGTQVVKWFYAGKKFLYIIILLMQSFTLDSV